MGVPMKPPPPPAKRKSGFFGSKGPRMAKPEMSKKETLPGIKKSKPPKKHKKPLFSFGKKKSKPFPPPVAPPAAAPPTGAPPSMGPPAVGGPAIGGTQTAANTPASSMPPQVDTAPGMKPKKKSLFGSKPKKEKPKKEKKPKPEKKARPKREKKVRAPREKKPKQPKKPLFSFGKKKAAESQLGPGYQAEGMEHESVLAGEEEGRGSPLGKKGPKKPRVKEPKAPKAKKAHKGGSGLGGSKQSPIGLDLGRTSITAARLRYQTGGSQLLQTALDSLPEGLIEEGEVRDVEALAFAIKEFWKTHKIKGRKVSLGLANQKVVVRTFEFPLLAEKELRSAIEFQAQDYIPIPVEEAVFDFHVLGRFKDEDGIEKQKVLVVAAQKDMVMDYINAIKRAKLTIAGVDLQAFALLRALAPTSFIDAGPADRATAIANIAADVTNLVVDVAGEPQFTRIISFGGDDFTKVLQELLGISFEEAEVLKASVGLPEPAVPADETAAGGVEWNPAAEPTGIIPPEESTGIIPPGEPAGIIPSEPGGGMPPAGGPAIAGGPPEPAPYPETKPEPYPEVESEQTTRADVQRTLEVTADALAEEIRRSLDYYMSQEQSVSIDRLIISGGGAMLKNIDKHLSQLFPFSVEVGNPLMRITQNKSNLSDTDLQVLAPRLAIAIGLAQEDEGPSNV